MATAVVYVVLLAVPGHTGTSHYAGPMPASAERLCRYGIALGERVTPAGQDAAHVLGRINTLALWPPVALGLLWSARRDRTLSVRFAWPRDAVTLVATVEVPVVVVARQLLAVLSAAVVPIAAWYSVGRLRHREAKLQRRVAGAQEPGGDVVVLQSSRTQAPEPQVGPESSPSPWAG